MLPERMPAGICLQMPVSGVQNAHGSLCKRMYQLPTQVLSAAGQHQVLIFVHSRKETAKTARYLKETALANDTLMRFMKASPGVPLLAGTSTPICPARSYVPSCQLGPSATLHDRRTCRLTSCPAG
jgi:hypothetical protein